LLFFQTIKNKAQRFPNPGKFFGFVLTPETMEKYNGLRNQKNILNQKHLSQKTPRLTMKKIE
jgi:hypothetical protein